MKEQRFIPLYRRLQHMLLVPCILAVFFCIGILLLSISFLQTIHHVYGQQDAYASYFEHLRNVDISLAAYLASPGEMAYQTCQRDMRNFLESAEQLVTFNGSGAVRNYYYMAETYLESVEGALSKSSYTIEEAEERLSETQVWKDNIMKNQNALWIILEAEREESEASLVHYVQMQGCLTAGIFLILMLTCFFASRRFIVRMTKPIQQLTEYVESTKDLQHIPKAEFSVEPGDETYILAESFSRMMRKLGEQYQTELKNAQLEKELQTAKYELLRSEANAQKLYLQVLQSRVNPHFLFNSLSIAISIALDEEADKTCGVLETLAEYLQYSLSKLDKTVTLSEEIRNVQNYFQIQRERFGERICFQILLEEACADSLIPAMIIQPMVENSVTHGIDSFKGGGYVEVRVRKSGEKILLEVEDNGVGMEDDQIQRLNERFKKGADYDDTKGIGLYNVYQRMAIFFGDEVTVRIQSAHCEKTVFSFLFPDRKREYTEELSIKYEKS